MGKRASAVAVLMFAAAIVLRAPAGGAQKEAVTVALPTVTIVASIDGGPWKRDAAIYPLKGQKVTLKVDRLPGGTPRWYRIVPDISEIYKNANHPWEPNPYKWVGLAKIDYSRTELTRFRGQWEIQPFSAEPEKPGQSRLSRLVSAFFRSKSDSPNQHDDVGSFWFQVEVEKDGGVRRSSGIEDSDKKGLSPRVFRVSVREGDGYLGYVTTFFNVPGLFGSIPYQCTNYIGADCCDVLTAAYGAWTGKPFKKDYSVAMLVGKLPKVTECNVLVGKPDTRLAWGKEIRPGLLIAVRYEGAKSYQHIGVLYSDADKDGVLSKGDGILHAGPRPLRHSTLDEGQFDGHVVILEPKFSLLLE